MYLPSLITHFKRLIKVYLQCPDLHEEKNTENPILFNCFVSLVILMGYLKIYNMGLFSLQFGKDFTMFNRI